MKSLPVVLRAAAHRDISDALNYYQREAGAETARAFVDRLEEAFEIIAPVPSVGSSRYAWELEIPELKFWRLTQFPWLVFYIVRSDRIDVWRILHARRDIPASFQED